MCVKSGIDMNTPLCDGKRDKALAVSSAICLPAAAAAAAVDEVTGFSPVQSNLSSFSFYLAILPIHPSNYYPIISSLDAAATRSYNGGKERILKADGRILKQMTIY